MSTRTEHRRQVQLARERGVEARKAEEWAAKRRRWNSVIGWTAGLVVVGAAVAFGLVTSRPAQTADVRVAPAFTLTDTSGNAVNLADFRGHNVLLYFSEGAGCQACLVQMGAIEKDPAFVAADVTVLPIVMNSREEIMADMVANKVTTPFLLDDGSVSTAYGTIGQGMHSGLPGHSFVLVDKAGQERWYGEYPSMWLSTTDLLGEIQDHLRS